jgi:hypothetical protein
VTYYTTRRKQRLLSGPAFLMIVFFGLIVGIATILIPAYADVHYKTCTVKKLDRTSKYGESGSDARVYTDNCGTFKVADSTIHWRHNSADVYGSLTEGQTYLIKYYGWRIGLTSTFPNILEAKQVS